MDAGTDADAGDSAVDSGTLDTGVDSGTLDTGPALVGHVLALSDQINVGAGPSPRSIVTASFGPEVTDICTHRTVGGCALVECPDTTPPVTDGGVDAGADAGVGPAADAGADAGVDAGPPPPAANAGRLTVNGGIAPATLAPSADGTYPAFISAMLLWASGDSTVDFAALGSDTGIPAFDQSVPAPSTVSLTAPDSTLAPITVTRFSGMDLAWTGSTNGVVAAMLTQRAPAPSTATVSLRCDFDGATASGNLPGIALTSFEVGPATLSLMSSSSATVSGTDPWSVDVTAIATGALADGTAANVAVTLE